MPRRSRLELYLVGALLLGAGVWGQGDDDDDNKDDDNDGGDDNNDDGGDDGGDDDYSTVDPTAEPTISPTAEPTQTDPSAPVCAYVQLSNDGMEPLMRAPDTCWNDRESQYSDYFECNSDGTLSYYVYEGVNCLEDMLNSTLSTMNITEMGLQPISTLNGQRALESWNCGLSDCWVEVTYFNVTNDDCPITYSMDRSSYTLNTCTYNDEIEANTMWECCEGGGVQLSEFADDDDTCSGEPTYQEIFEGDSDETGGSTCADFSKANPEGDSDIEWRCNGQTVVCYDESEEKEETPGANGTQIALVVIFTILAFSGCIYCVYSGHMINARNLAQTEDAGLLADKQPNYQAGGIKA